VVNTGEIIFIVQTYHSNTNWKTYIYIYIKANMLTIKNAPAGGGYNFYSKDNTNFIMV
jgi:hypothetical protein